MKKSSIEMAVQKQIEEARLLLKPTPVKIGHMPRWFAVGVRKAHGRLVYSSAEATLMNGPYCRERWLDHWGSTDYHGKPCFVSEPYNLSLRAIEAIHDFCRDAGFEWRLCSNSWWYPGHTLRVLIYRPKPDKDAIDKGV